MPITRRDYERSELDWFAIDGPGHFALCSSAGFADIPSQVLADTTTEDWPIHHIENLIAAMPEVGGIIVEGRGPGTCKDWKDLAARGLYIYDWRHWKGPYERIVRPTKPIHATMIPRDLMQHLRPIKMPNADLRELLSFDEESVA